MRKLLLLLCILCSIGSIYGQTLCQSNPLTADNIPGIIGQSITMSSCTGGFFYSFTFDKTETTTGLTGDITIYSGESVDIADQIYQQTGISIMDAMGIVTIVFSGGTGTLAFTPGQQYTIHLIPSSNVSVGMDHNGSTYAGGKRYQVKSNSFLADEDIEFEVYTISTNPLPVELTKFTANKKSERVELSWQTATEKNNEGFDIERSADGENWQTIGFVQGHGTTQEVQDYTFTDEAPLNGTNYYRLKQVDFDGQFEYSMVEVVQIETDKQPLSVFPNPIEDELNILNGEGQATIYNTLGQAVRALTINNSQLSIDVSDLPKGQYILHILQQNGNVITKQFVK